MTHLVQISITLAPQYGLEPLTLGVANPEVAQHIATAYGEVAKVFQSGGDYSHLSPALFDAISLLAKGAFSESNLPFNDASAQAQAMVANLQQQLAQAQGDLANIQNSANAAIEAARQEAYHQGLAAAGQVAANNPNVAVSGFSLNIDTTELARQIAGHLSGGNAKVETQQAQPQNLALNPLNQQGGMALGGGMNLGKTEAAQGTGAQPESASGAANQHASYSLDPALIGDGSGSGGGVLNTSKAGDRTVASIRGDEGLTKVGLPTAKKQFSAGALVYIVPSSDSAQWNDKVALVADPKEGGDLAEIAEGATAVLTKNLHYYVPK